MIIEAQHYWNTVGSTKDFEDPLFMEKLAPFISTDSKIVEYGCGYGRLLDFLQKQGYNNLLGFDYAENMIARGKKTSPSLDLRLLEVPNVIPCPNGSADIIIMSTVLCCMIDPADHQKLIREIYRVLKKNGVLYLADFLICNDKRYTEKYAEGLRRFGIHGVYTTSENLTVRHFTSQYVLDLLKNYDVQWFEQFDFKTMNHNPARIFHCIGKKA